MNKVDRKRSLSYQALTGCYKCFRCGASGRAEFTEGAETYEPRIEIIKQPDCFYDLSQEPGRTSLDCAPFRKYVFTRMSERVLSQTHVGACLAGNMDGRVIVPMFANDGTTWCWYVGRTINPGVSKKYLYPRGSRKGIIYNHAALLVETDEPVIVTEGCFDVFPFWPNAVALLGKVTEEQYEALLVARRPVCVVLDGDAWQEGAMLALRLQMCGQRATALKLEPKKDPDDCVEEVRYLARRSFVHV